MRIKSASLAVSAVCASLLPLFYGCSNGSVGGVDVQYNPAEQLLPHSVQKIALHPVVNKTQQFGISKNIRRS